MTSVRRIYYAGERLMEMADPDIVGRPVPARLQREDGRRRALIAGAVPDRHGEG